MTFLRGLARISRRHRCCHSAVELLLEHGQFFKPQGKPRHIRWAMQKECFKNAAHLALEHKDLTYVEGYADSDLFPLEHAWVVDAAGVVIDNTWRSPGTVYYGIPFRRAFLVKALVTSGYYGLLGGAGGRPSYVLALKPGALKSAISKLC